MATTRSTLGSLYESLKAGHITRREFLNRAAATGIGASMALFMANSAVIAAAGGSKNGFAVYAAQDGSPVASPVPGAAGFPDAGTENQTRGQGGELRLIQWQAPTMAATHSNVGTKDGLAAQLVLEPIMEYNIEGAIIPKLVTEVPSVENGLLAEDLTSVTFNLLPDVVWSDGEPFTANDIVFTWQWVTNPDNAAVNYEVWNVIENITADDDLTATVTFKQPAAAWFEPFTGHTTGSIYPSHVFGDDPTNANVDFLTNPIGTGPFVVEEFRPNDQVTYVANENYREPNKPFFARALIKGGGEAAAAARAVCQTGEFHYAWNLQVEWDVLSQIDAEGEFGEVVVAPGASVERIHINFSDPNTEVEGQRSHVGTPHPFLTDPAVRQAMNLACDRERVASLYGEGQPPTANILTGIPSLESPNTSWEYDLEQAAQVLEDAGWVLNDDNVREKDGVTLEVTYATSVNSLRQQTQAVIKQAFDSIGIATRLEQIDSGIYFDAGAGNEQNISHFYWDIDMYTNSPTSPIPLSWWVSWYAGEGDSLENIAQAENDWQGQNYSRWVNEEFDAMYEELETVTDMDRAAELMIAMNDLVIGEVVVIPLVNRSVDTYAASHDLRAENLQLGPFHDLTYWNVANWNFADGVEAD